MPDIAKPKPPKAAPKPKPEPKPKPAKPETAGAAVRAAMAEVAANLRSVQFPPWTGGKPHPVQSMHWSNDDALALVTTMATHGKSQRTIAAHFQMNFKTFEEHLGKDRGDNALQLAWQKGRAAHEQHFADLFVAVSASDSKGAVIAAIFYAKAQFGWQDRAQTNLTINTGPQWVLPGAMSPEDYYKKLGVTGPREAVSIAKRDLTAVPLLPQPIVNVPSEGGTS